MHRYFSAQEAERMGFQNPALHPFEPFIAFAWNNDIHLLDIETGSDEIICRFSLSESHMPATSMSVSFTSDGRDLIIGTCREGSSAEPRIDPANRRWIPIRDEAHIVGKIWR